jgi:P4 family phage/plasmid primase-like protien
MTSTPDSFEHYLNSKKAEKGGAFTHTRIGDKSARIFGGSYLLADEDLKAFMERYYRHVFENHKMEYLTEKQLIEDGPILIDIDLRYAPDVSTKQHTSDHILDAVVLYAEKCSELVQVDVNVPIEVFVMEKSDVNRLDAKTKDGIHIIMGMAMHKGLQVLLRNKVLPELENIWEDLPITNTWADVLDEGVTKGFVNWQLYGSRKPSNQAYLIKHHYTLNYDGDTWTVEDNDIASFDTHAHIMKLSARYSDHPKFEIQDGVEDDFQEACQSLGKQGGSRPKFKIKKASGGKVSYNNIDSEATLDALIEELFADLGPINYRLKETHDYAMSLPVTYYGPGSYTKWIRVGWALASTNPKMFLTWLKFSCQDNCRDTLKGKGGKFDWGNVPELFEMWRSFDFGSGSDNLTHRSIMYWSKNDAPDKYDQIRQDTIDFFVEQTIATATEFDLATVLFNIFKDRFVCVSIKNNCWYEYKNHRWEEIDSGSTLRLLISKGMWQTYIEKVNEETRKLQTMEQSDQRYEVTRKRTGKLAEIAFYLKKTTWKNNIMREARELFYDQDFITKLDQNPYLLCFNNYVIDFRNRTHRRGQPDDYISKCTNIDYVPLNREKHKKIIAELEQFMLELFPDETLRKYMWEHLASCLVGTNENQTFNIYTGSGRNGKSKLVDLMSKGMGDYKGTVPITLITQKRNSIGSTSSEIVQLMGTRYAVMQEPSKGDRINEGIMKEITGGDPIQGRALFKDTVTFIPQFKLVVCTNTLFDIKSNDDGTWRRIRVCDFMSKFLEAPFDDEDKFPQEQYPHQFKIDKNIDHKFAEWAPVFMAMLVDKSYEHQGNVNDCPVVMASSDEYREGQDYLAEFAKDKVQKKTGEKVKKTELLETFRQWYTTHYGRGIPKGREVYDFMDRRFGRYRQGWHNVAIIYDEEEDIMDEC